MLGEVGNITLGPGQSKEVPVALNFDSNLWFEDCQGVDFNGLNGGNTSPGSGNSGSGITLTLEGLGNFNSNLNKQLATVGQCYPVRAALYQNHTLTLNQTGSEVMVAPSVNVNGTSDFYTDPGCAVNLVGNIAVLNGLSRSSVFYY